MKAVKTLSLIAILMLPGAAFAMCDDHKEASITCAEGTSWDPASRTCVATTS